MVKRAAVLKVKVNGKIVSLGKGLLTAGDRNTKLAKGEEYVMTCGLPLMAHKAAGAGINMCEFASLGCIAGCLVRAGRAMIWNNINKGRTARTRAWKQMPELFIARLIYEIARWLIKAKAAGKRLAVRLNMFSDEAWERLIPQLFAMFPEVIFYDYTKDPKRAMKFARGEFPANYHLTFSRSENNERACRRLLKAGCNVSVVFDLGAGKNRKALPARWKGFPVIDGDQTDMRFADPRGVVVGLSAKRTRGFAKARAAGFFVVVK